MDGIHDFLSEFGQVRGYNLAPCQIMPHKSPYNRHSLHTNYHITGSYKDEALYGEYIDFSDGTPLDINMEGTFGCIYWDETFDFGED